MFTFTKTTTNDASLKHWPATVET